MTLNKGNRLPSGYSLVNTTFVHEGECTHFEEEEEKIGCVKEGGVCRCAHSFVLDGTTSTGSDGSDTEKIVTVCQVKAIPDLKIEKVTIMQNAGQPWYLKALYLHKGHLLWDTRVRYQLNGNDRWWMGKDKCGEGKDDCCPNEEHCELSCISWDKEYCVHGKISFILFINFNNLFWAYKHC